MSLEEKLSQYRGNYPLENFSVGSCMFIAAFHQDLGISLSNDELRELGSIIRLKRNKDYIESANFAFNLLNACFEFGNELKIPQIDKHSFGTFKEYYQFMATHYLNPKNLPRVSNQAYENLEKNKNGKKRFSNKPISIQIITREDLINENPQINPKDLEDFLNLRISQKSENSGILKFLNRVRKVVSPNNKELKELDIYNSNRINEREIYESFLRFMGFILNSGESFHISIEEPDYLVSAETHGFLERYYSPLFIDYCRDIILRDVGRGTIVASGNLYDRIKGIFKNDFRQYKNLEFSDELSINQKDRSVNSSYMGINEGSYLEMKLRYPFIDVECEFGAFEHSQYKSNGFRKFLKHYENSKSLQMALHNLCITFSKTPREILKP